MPAQKNLASFQSANVMPWKLFQDTKLMRSITSDKIILPRHLQVGPTSACNLNCSYCSCKNRIRTVLSIDELKAIVDLSVRLKVAGFTITGDGEPLLHPKINQFLEYALERGIKSGLVTNGLMLDHLDKTIAPLLTWLRISFDDDREFDPAFIRQLEILRGASDEIDIAFSYVVSPHYQLEKIAQVIRYANSRHFTHVRLVSDLYQTELVDINALQSALENLGVDTSRCIFQGRSQWTAGVQKCWISLLKPMIASDGYLYPCCGVQYALPDADRQRTFPIEMRMGHHTELPAIIQEQRCFDGSRCVRCYYNNYNTALSGLLPEYQHPDFV